MKNVILFASVNLFTIRKYQKDVPTQGKRSRVGMKWASIEAGHDMSVTFGSPKSICLLEGGVSFDPYPHEIQYITVYKMVHQDWTVKMGEHATGSPLIPLREPNQKPQLQLVSFHFCMAIHRHLQVFRLGDPNNSIIQ